MDELELVRDLHGALRPDPWLKARVRARLEAEGKRARRRLFTWSVAIACLAAATIAMGLTLPRAPQAPGRTILLAAATSAASSPATSGTYWHLKQQTGSDITELWATPDGKAWRSAGARPKVIDTAPFSMAGKSLTFEQIQRLPTGASALMTWVTGMLPAGAGDDVLADALSGLLWRKPSPPGVRAAAYRALADLPNVRYLGKRVDPRERPGEVFSFALGGVQRTLIIDPVTSRVLSCTDDRQTYVVLEAGFTDRGPKA